MAKRLQPVPDDLTFQETYVSGRTWTGWWCREFTCERYPDLKIRVHGNKKSRELVQYIAHGQRYPDLKLAYRALMKHPRRVIRDKNIPRRNANEDGGSRPRTGHVSKEARRRNRRD